MKNCFIVFAILCSLMIVGCPSPEHVKHQHFKPADNSQPIPGQNNADLPSWANQKIQATGESAINPKYASNPAQAKLMAKRGAKMDARRNLLERVLGLNLDSKTLVKDMVTEADEINAESSGFVRSSYVISSNFSDGIATVTMELNLYNVYQYMKTKRIYYK